MHRISGIRPCSQNHLLPDTYRNQDPPVETSAARVEALNEESEEIAIYLIRRHTGLTNGEIGKIFKMKAQAVSKAGIKIVFSRADPFAFASRQFD